MTFLATHFTDAQLAPVLSGIRTFIRLQGLIYDENPLVWSKWLADESDLKLELRSVADAMRKTQSMVGKRKYQNVDFDAPKEVAKDLMVFLTFSHDGSESATLRKRNLPMFHLVIEPVINLFYQFDHQSMIDHADELVDAVIELIDTSTDYGSYDDALVAQAQVATMVREREDARKAAAEAKRKKRRRDPLLEMLAAYGGDKSTDDEEVTDEVEELYL